MLAWGKMPATKLEEQLGGPALPFPHHGCSPCPRSPACPQLLIHFKSGERRKADLLQVMI